MERAGNVRFLCREDEREKIKQEVNVMQEMSPLQRFTHTNLSIDRHVNTQRKRWKKHVHVHLKENLLANACVHILKECICTFYHHTHLNTSIK